VVAAIRPPRGSLSGGRLSGLVWPARLVAAAIAVAATTAQLIDFGVYDQRLRPLDMMTHNSVFGVVSLAALGIAVLASWAAVLRGPERRVELAVLGALLALLLALRVAQPAHVLIVALPVSAVALALLWTTAPPGATRRVLRDGSLVLVLAFVVHGIGSKIVSMLGLGPETWGYQLKAVVKHSGELAGWVLVALGLSSIVAQRDRAARPSPQPAARPVAGAARSPARIGRP
jgi:hypothetical protein